MAGSITTRGIVLKRRVYGEADRILTILTPTFGKLDAIAKGSRRITSKLGGHIELFYVVDWVLAEGRTWHVVTGADTVQDFPGLRTSLETVRHASHVAQLVHRLVPEGENVAGVYRLVEATLGSIVPGSSPMVLRQFEWQLLLAIGNQPELGRCSHCGAGLDAAKLGLCPTRGGALCPGCMASEAVHIPIRPESLKILRLFERAPVILATRLTVDPKVLVELERITRAFLEHTLEAPLMLEHTVHEAVSAA